MTNARKKEEETPETFLASALINYHRSQLTSGNKALADAVMVKVVALLVLAFDAPAVRGGPVDYDDALAKLRAAINVINHAN
jgi:hypothetical protein